jgi:hypothetical protein
MTSSIKISEDRILEIYIEAKRRMNLWLSHSSFDEMTVMGSNVRFDMALGLHGGYLFDKPEWMRDKAFNDFVTESEFDSSDYQEIINQLFKQAKEKK